MNKVEKLHLEAITSIWDDNISASRSHGKRIDELYEEFLKTKP